MTTTISSADPLRERRGGRLTALLLALALLLCLSACGAKDPICGSYTCVAAETGGLRIPASLPGEEPLTLFLASDGRGTLSRGDDSGSLRWTWEGDTLRLDLGETAYDAALDGEEILLEAEEGLILRFSRETAESEESSDRLEWYGWWEVKNSRGPMPDSWRDCCACLESGDYGPELRLWDEDSSYDEPLALVQMRPGESFLRSESGFFLLEELGEDQWRLNPAAQTLELRGSYRHEDESFDYRILLRPWGADWPKDERLPFRYTDWYLPLREAGESMPQRIG